MKKPLVILILTLLAATYVKAQDSSVQRTIKEFYDYHVSVSNYVYVADSTILRLPFSYRQLYLNVNPSDTSLLKTILKYGQPVVLSQEQLLFTLSAKAMKLKDFTAFRTQMELTDDEAQTLRAIDSNARLINKSEDTSSQYNRLKMEEDSLFKTAHFASYWTKLGKASKRLLYFYPLVKYQKHTLVVMGSYASIMDSFLTVSIVSND